MGRIIPGLLALVWTTVASAATSLHFGPPPSWVRATPIPAPGATTSAATKVLLIDEQIELSRRTVSYYLENVVRIQTPQELSAMGTVKVDWDPDTDVLIIHKVHILRGDKVIDVLGAGQTFTIARRGPALSSGLMPQRIAIRGNSSAERGASRSRRPGR